MLGAASLVVQSIDLIITIDTIYRFEMTDLKLKDLRYLVAVADARHFGRAAAKCFVSQPTLSAQLRKLEQYLGVQLIERRPRRVTLTEAGEEVALRARTMLETADAIVTLAQTRRDPLAGQLRLAGGRAGRSGCGDGSAPAAMASSRERAPLPALIGSRRS